MVRRASSRKASSRKGSSSSGHKSSKTSHKSHKINQKSTPSKNTTNKKNNVSSSSNVKSNNMSSSMMTGGILGYMLGRSSNSNDNIKPIKKTYVTNINIEDGVLGGCGIQLQQVLDCTNDNSNLNQCAKEIEQFKICLKTYNQ